MFVHCLVLGSTSVRLMAGHSAQTAQATRLGTAWRTSAAQFGMQVPPGRLNIQYASLLTFQMLRFSSHLLLRALSDLHQATQLPIPKQCGMLPVAWLPLFSRMRSKVFLFTLGVGGLRVCLLDVAFMFSTVRNCPQPFGTIWPCLW